MKISMRKIMAIFELKWQTITKNMSVMSTPIIAILFVIIIRLLMTNIAKDTDGMAFNLEGFVLNFGLIFNVIMGGILMSSYPLAEEKEKNTLRVLMTSSVNGVEYFIGSMLPILLILTITDIIIVIASGVAFSKVPWLMFFFITIMCSIISILIGYMIGMYSKNQMQAGIIGMPVMLIFIMVPCFRIFSKTLDLISGYTFVGILSKFSSVAFSDVGYHLNIKDTATLLIWLIIGIGLFVFAYKQKGLDEA